MAHTLTYVSFQEYGGIYVFTIVSFALALCVSRFLRWKKQPSSHDDGVGEPPVIRSALPFIGHLIGMVRFGAKYFEIINQTTDHPIFTLPMLTGRSYVVCDATLAGYIQRNAKTLSFYSLIVEVTRRLIAFDKEATRITFYNMNGEHGPGGLMARVHEMMNANLAPGLGLNAITATQMKCTGEMLNRQNDGVLVNLYAWQRHIFSVCNMNAIYGPENIFAVHPELEQAFWDFEDGMLGLVIDILPSLTARKAFRARQKVLDGLVEFVQGGRYKKASPLIQERVETNLEYGMSSRMAGHAELILMFGILGNAVPSNFWLIANIFSRPDLLQQVRDEVQAALDLQVPKADSEQGTESGDRMRVSAKSININTCPFLYSCYRETLREIAILMSARLVLQDTILANRYLLRKDSVVQIAGSMLGRDTAVWGGDAREFNPHRFLVPESTVPTTKSSGKPTAALPMPQDVPSAAFRAFGGGTVICPGRHFAQSELMTLSAIVALSFEITEADGSVLRLPSKDDTRIPLSVMKPRYDPQVRIRRRKGWEGASWEINA